MSSLYLEINYARIVGQSIDRWKIKKDSPFHGNGRCPICGDSATNKAKCRFHIIQHDDTLFCKCFNCDYSTNLVGFLKVHHPALYSEFIFERYRVNGEINQPIITKPKVLIDDSMLKPVKTASKTLIKLDLPLVSDLPKDHPAARYVASRCLPDYPFQFSSNFFNFSSQYNADLSKFKTDEARLIIPFFDREGNCYAFQGRSFAKNPMQKYITIVVNAKIPKIFGLGKVDFKKPLYICEGPIDSLFLDNCLASVNASLVSTAKKLAKVINKNQVTIIFDNEPRNKAIVNMYDEAINDGYKLVIWPTSPDIKEDINDLVLKNKKPEKIIAENTYSGLMAQLEFKKWKRC